jgi:cytosine/adenosine deaminase-related metal-dependent hydrolase
MVRTVVAGGDVVIWRDGSHAILRDGNVVIEDDHIVEVTTGDPGPADVTIDATGRLVSPGFINCHVHAGIDTQVLMTDKGASGYYNSGMIVAAASAETMENRGPALSEEEQRAAGLYPIVELLKSGVTTFFDIGGSIGNADLFAELVGESGARAYLGPGFEQATWLLDASTGAFRYHWNDEAGWEGFRRAVRFVEEHDGDFDGRVRAAIIPLKLDTVRPDLLREAGAAAESLGVPLTIHSAQAGYEFHELIRREAKTPVEYLATLGLLTPRLIVGHGIFMAGHRLTAMAPKDDLRLLADGGVSVAHSAVVFARRGIAMESFQRYLDAGVRMVFGSDTLPRDLLQEMRLAAYLCKVVDNDWSAAQTRDLYNAATVRASEALGRDDLGRIAPGARADLFIADLRKLHIGPIVDPILALIHEANASDIDTVLVDGKVVVDDGRHVRIDHDWLLETGERIGQKQRAAIEARDWKHRSAEAIYAPVFPFVDA